MKSKMKYNSIYMPKNGIVWRSGRSTVRFKRIDVDLAKRLLGEIEQSII